MGVNVRESLIKNVPFCQYSPVLVRVAVRKPSQQILDLTPFMYSQDLLITLL